jgi:deoxyxylulose-5-phosphate synthase
MKNKIISAQKLIASFIVSSLLKQGDEILFLGGPFLLTHSSLDKLKLYKKFSATLNNVKNIQSLENEVIKELTKTHFIYKINKKKVEKSFNLKVYKATRLGKPLKIKSYGKNEY